MENINKIEREREREREHEQKWTRYEIIKKIGSNYLVSNTEGMGFSYTSKLFDSNVNLKNRKEVDLKFVYNDLTILVETKPNEKFTNANIKQLKEYIRLEKILNPKNNIIGILASTISDTCQRLNEDDDSLIDIKLNSIEYYYSQTFSKKRNDKIKVLQTTNSLNKLLNKLNIPERIRSQFVGTCLVALNNGLDIKKSDVYDEDLVAKNIINKILQKIKERVSTEENDKNKIKKIEVLEKVLSEQSILSLSKENLIDILIKIKSELIPFINDFTSEGEDLLNLFFTTFNKYVGKDDKNQAFTPTHITDFMCDIVGITKNSVVLDPTCGSGSFLIQAMVKMLKQVGENGDEWVRERIKSKQIYGIEKEKQAFGLATTNMLIHKDGKSNIINNDLFKSSEWIEKNDVNVILMNPPFNGKNLPEYAKIDEKNGEDVTKGLFFVHYAANNVKSGKLATILPLACAKGGNEEIVKYKKKMLEKHTLLAVFTLPDDIFYPGAGINTCIMLFDLNKPHNDSNKKTFLASFKDDGFVKRKYLGRVEDRDWQETKKMWIDMFHHKIEKEKISIYKHITYNDEWLAEPYLETNYLQLSEKDFLETLREFIAFKIRSEY
ncbi:N-6 DNA methylase [Candidatus Mycoplasma pogonae]